MDHGQKGEWKREGRKGGKVGRGGRLGMEGEKEGIEINKWIMDRVECVDG